MRRRWVFRDLGREFEFMTWHDSTEDVRRQAEQRSVAESILRGCIGGGRGDSIVRRNLVEMCRALGVPDVDGSRVSTARLQQAVLRAAGSGRLLLAGLEGSVLPATGGTGAPAVPEPPPPPPVRKVAKREETPGKTAWLELSFAREDGSIAVGELYRIALPNGFVREARVPESGVVRFEGLVPGSFRIWMPGMEEEDWSIA